MLRFYVHYERFPEHTHLAKVNRDSQRSVASLGEEFVQAYNSRHGQVKTLKADELELRNEKRRPLDDHSLLAKAVANRADVFIVERVGKKAGPPQLNQNRESAGDGSLGPLAGSSAERTGKTPPPEAKGDLAKKDHVGNHSSVSSQEGGVNSQKADVNSQKAGGVTVINDVVPDESKEDVLKVSSAKTSSTPVDKRSGSASATKEVATCAEEVRAASERSLSIPLIRALLVKGLEAQDAQNYRQATKFFEEVLQIVPKQQICLRALASMALAVGKYPRAKRLLTEAVETYPADAGFRARLAEAFLGLEQYEASVKQNAAALEILERRPPGQRDSPITLQNSVPSSYPGSNYQMGIPFYLLNKKRERRDNAGDLTVPHAGDLKGAVTENEVKCALARALYRAGAGELACNLVTKVLEGKENNFGMLFEYALIASENRMPEDAMRALLKLLVVRQEHRGVRESLAALVRRPGGFEMLQRETGGAGQVASAQAFMASVLKDYGLVREAAALYGKAVALEPRAVSYALNWLHALELCNEPAKALEVARDFVRRNRRIALGSALSLGESLDCLEDLPLSGMDAKNHAGFTVLRAYDIEAPSGENAPSVLLPTASQERSGNKDMPGAQFPTASKGPPSSQGLPGTPPTSNGSSSAGKEPAGAVKEEGGSGGENGLEGESRGIRSGAGTKAGDMEVEEIESPGVLRARLAAEKGGQGAVTEERGRAGRNLKSDDLEQAATASGAPSGRISTPSSSGLATSQKGPLNSLEAPAKINYSPEQLDVLAVLFTVVKILYIGGAVGRAHQLATRVERARRLSEKPLHETMVRNEAAYFGCIYQVLTEYPIPLPLPDVNSCPPLFLMGDSHCLTPAWRKVELRGQSRLLTPLLVTGLKCWHLRVESVFYPKIQFDHVAASIPDNAQVIMMFGEIDCREGIVVSVDKGRYKDLEEGVNATVNIYMKVLRRLVRERGFEIFVHPPPTVLDETRPIVCLFAQVLKRKVLAASKSIAESKRSSADQKRNGALHWLDFYDNYLDAEGKLKEKYKLDGTHMSPEYVELLVREIRKVPAAED